MNPNALADLFSQGGFNGGGLVPFEQLEELRKSLSTGYGTDVEALTGGGALRVQSLDKTLFATIQEQKHFRLFNALQKSNAIATVDEYTTQTDVGGFLGGSTNTESGTISDETGSYARKVGMVKFLTTRRQVTLVAQIQGGIVEAEAVEQMAGAKKLLTDAEYLSFEGDDAVVPTEFPGILAQLVDGGLTDHIIDLAGAALSDQDAFADASALIANYGNFGQPTDVFYPLSVQADLDKGLDPAFRVSLPAQPESMKLGAPVVGIRTSNGEIATHSDVFVRDEVLQKPFDIRYPAIAAANVGIKPTVSAANATGTDGSFTTAQAGSYYWAVAGVNKDGQSGVAFTAQKAVTAGQHVVLTITASSGGQETGYVIFRSKLGGVGTAAEVREMIRIPKDVSGTTTWTDKNEWMPGTAKAFIINNAPGDKAITWRQYLPMMKFPLYPTNAAVIPWAQLLFGYLRLGKVNQHVCIKNIVPNGAKWKPFG